MNVDVHGDQVHGSWFVHGNDLGDGHEVVGEPVEVDPLSSSPPPLATIKWEGVG